MDMGFRVFWWNVLRPDIFKLLLWFSLVCCAAASVTYDHRAIVINGQRRILISGSIHYPRSTPEVIYIIMPMWFTGCFCLSFLPFIMTFLLMGVCGSLLPAFVDSEFKSLFFVGFWVVADVA